MKTKTKIILRTKMSLVQNRRILTSLSIPFFSWCEFQ